MDVEPHSYFESRGELELKGTHPGATRLDDLAGIA